MLLHRALSLRKALLDSRGSGHPEADSGRRAAVFSNARAGRRIFHRFQPRCEDGRRRAIPVLEDDFPE